MKKIIITLVFSIASFFVNAQNVFDKYDQLEGVSAVKVNKKMFQMMGSVKVDSNDAATQQYLALIKKMDMLKVYTTSNLKIATDMKVTVDKHFKSAGLEELIRINDNGENLKIWVKSGATENQIKELLLFSEEPNKQNQTVLMSLSGDFNLQEIAVLTDKMKLPGGDVFKKATNRK